VTPTDDSLSRIQALAAADAVRITQHAHQEMLEENIRMDDMLHAIANGRILEDYPDHRRGACCLLHGVDTDNRDIHVVCTIGLPTLIIVTVYLPKPPKWVTPTQRRTRP
jgi:Domain of unknown function (DUF4258)